MTEASRYVSAQARRAAEASVARRRPHAILLIGSVAERLSGRIADIDLIIDHDAQALGSRTASTTSLIASITRSG